MMSTGPSTEPHSQPTRNNTVQRLVSRRRRSFQLGPRKTVATTGSPVTGWSMVPAFTTELWTEPSERATLIVTSPLSPTESSEMSSKVVMASP